MGILTEEQLEFWERSGFLHLPGYFAGEAKSALQDWVLDLESRPETPGKWMKYFEDSAINKSELQLDRKVLADMAVRDPAGFTKVVQQVMGQ